jgi:uncharacterized membrane protein YagU involved in acid resistance
MSHGLLRGAAAGFAATVPMTLAMEGLRAALPREQVRHMPPREVVDRTVDQTGRGAEVDASERIALTTVAHFAFGAAAGAMFGLLFQPRRHGRGATGRSLIGVGYGLAVWAVAYGVVLPSLGLHPAAPDDTTDRNEVLVASHIVWGAALGALS